MTLHLFNPENDLALGLGCRNYTPPPHAAALHRAGALLPMWWAKEGDRILATASLQPDADELRGRFGINGEIGFTADVTKASPWGWSADAVRQFENAGMPASLLPGHESIDIMRRLSHRRTSIEILSQLDGGYQLPVETSDPDEVIHLESMNPGCYVKSPWSCSGRGVFNAISLDKATLYQRAKGIINRQGSVMVERGLNKTLDFAVLFYSDGSRVTAKGLSIFLTEPRGMYTGNLVAPQSHLQEMLAASADITQLEKIINSEEKILTTLVAPHYRGWMGIDMMLHTNNGRTHIMPCVELNLRMTMGVAAMKVAQHLSITTPHIMAWDHNTPPAKGSIDLLPPHEGFALRLKPKA